jgi:hypothetical protein
MFCMKHCEEAHYEQSKCVDVARKCREHITCIIATVSQHNSHPWNWDCLPKPHVRFITNTQGRKSAQEDEELVIWSGGTDDSENSGNVVSNKTAVADI